jgi:hypothetical protein
MPRFPATIVLFAALNTAAAAQMPETPGPGGTRIAPGAPVTGWTPGGIGAGGAVIAPGPAARDMPMYRIGPGGVPLVLQPDPNRDRSRPTARLQPDCGNSSACVPEVLPHTLTLTITSRDAGPGQAPPRDAPIDSIRDLFAALRACWEPPAREQAQDGVPARESVQMSVRFSFKRSGDIMGPPFVTYTTPGASNDVRQVYRGAINAALTRCAPLPLSKSFAAAIAGQPISVRYVDDRAMSAEAPRP